MRNLFKDQISLILPLFSTIQSLKIEQVYFRLKYMLFSPRRKVSKEPIRYNSIALSRSIRNSTSLVLNVDIWSFNFLNIEKQFKEGHVNWSFQDYGMLWAFNLNYFGWLNQEEISRQVCLDILKNFYDAAYLPEGIILHPYPTSLRILNVSKFIVTNEVNEDWLLRELSTDIRFLQRRLEYNLLANHLLENAFALYVGGLLLGQTRAFKKGEELIIKELDEQIFGDGMHYERSPMYHLIILERLLDTLNFSKGSKIEELLRTYAIKMTGVVINWQNLERIPMFQDSAYNVASSIPSILEYSERLLGLTFPSGPSELKDSGYRARFSGKFYLFANVGIIGPSYQPGHAHADELNFELFYEGSPLIVDTGVSTYEKNQHRLVERSTLSHNCLTLDNKNSSEIWSGFRVGKRARVAIVEDSFEELQAEHFGYKDYLVSRSWKLNELGLTIIDEVTPKRTGSLDKVEVTGRIHIHPDFKVKMRSNNSFVIGNKFLLRFYTEDGAFKTWTKEFKYALGFNKTVSSVVILYTCKYKTLITISRVQDENTFSNG